MSVPDPELEPDCAGSFLLLQASNAKRANAITDNLFMVIIKFGCKGTQNFGYMQEGTRFFPEKRLAGIAARAGLAGCGRLGIAV